jgi:transposase
LGEKRWQEGTSTPPAEDLSVKGMARNRHLARLIADIGFFEFGPELEDKAAMRGGQVVGKQIK